MRPLVEFVLARLEVLFAPFNGSLGGKAPIAGEAQ